MARWPSLVSLTYGSVIIGAMQVLSLDEKLRQRSVRLRNIVLATDGSPAARLARYRRGPGETVWGVTLLVRGTANVA